MTRRKKATQEYTIAGSTSKKCKEPNTHYATCYFFDTICSDPGLHRDVLASCTLGPPAVWSTTSQLHPKCLQGRKRSLFKYQHPDTEDPAYFDSDAGGRHSETSNDILQSLG